MKYLDDDAFYDTLSDVCILTYIYVSLYVYVCMYYSHVCMYYAYVYVCMYGWMDV